MNKQEIQKLIQLNLELSCPLCGQQYSQRGRFPMILCSKQHACCERCLNQRVFKNQYLYLGIVQCPECPETVRRHQVIRMAFFDKIVSFRKSLNQKINETYIQEKMEEDQDDQDSDNIKIDADDEKITKLKNLEIYMLGEAQYYFMEDKFQQTIKICRKLIENNPSRKCKFVGFGSKEDFIGYEEEYIKQQYRSYVNNTEDRSPYDLLSLSLLLSSEYQQDKRWFTQQIESNIQNYKIYFALGLLQANFDKSDESIIAFKKAVKLNKHLEKAQQCIAFQYYAKDNIKMAKIYAQSSLSKNPKNKYSLFIDSVVTEDLQQKIKKLKQITKSYPQYLVPLFEIGWLYFLTKQLNQAIYYFQACLNKSEFYDSARIKLGECYLQDNQPEKVIQIFQETQLEDNNQQAIQLLAEAYLRVGLTKQAYQMIERCKEINPQNEKIQQILGAVYELQQKYQDAIEIYKQMLNKNPENTQLYKNIALAFLKKGDYFNAQEWNEQYMTDYPEDISIVIKIADFHYNEQRLQTALERYLQCFEINHQFKLFASKIIDIYQRKHFFEQALHWAKKWNDTQPENPDSWEALASISKTISNKIRSKEWQPKKKRHIK